MRTQIIGLRGTKMQNCAKESNEHETEIKLREKDISSLASIVWTCKNLREIP